MQVRRLRHGPDELWYLSASPLPGPAILQRLQRLPFLAELRWSSIVFSSRVAEALLLGCDGQAVTGTRREDNSCVVTDGQSPRGVVTPHPYVSDTRVNIIPTYDALASPSRC